ncbi:hypothetical protein BC828DRAFT_392763 [Blastocladiella britannica]|nr:hypothetical protein BC828DRAFT_392763 [Blastocladiella britannica]
MIDDVADLILAWAAGTIVSPAEAIPVLHVLPSARSPSVLTAVLSRGFLEFNPPALAHVAADAQNLICFLYSFPRHILFAHLGITLGAIATSSTALPIIQWLWHHAAGPATLGRMFWLDTSYTGVLAMATAHGWVGLVDWVLAQSKKAGLRSLEYWPRHLWLRAAAHGRTETIEWALDRGYLAELDFDLVLAAVSGFSPDTGGILVLERWCAEQQKQPGDGQVIMDLQQQHDLCAAASTAGSVAALDWWWQHIADPDRPLDPVLFAAIVDTALESGHVPVIQWWWTRFLAVRSLPALDGSTYQFGSANAVTSAMWSGRLDVVQWLWNQSHRTGKSWDVASATAADLFAFPSDWSHVLKHEQRPKVPYYWSDTESIPLVRWWINTLYDHHHHATSVVVPDLLVARYVRHGRVAGLDSLLDLSTDNTVQVEWPADLVAKAVEWVQVGVLEWWDRNHARPMLPSISTGRGLAKLLSNAIRADAVDVVEWWHARRTSPETENEWQQVAVLAVEYNARHVQAWLLLHQHNLLPQSTDDQFTEPMVRALRLSAMPFTLNFVAAVIGPSPPHSPALANLLSSIAVSIPVLTWRSLHFEPLKRPRDWFPLTADQWLSLLEDVDTVTLEWWLQAHVRAAKPIHFPSRSEMVDAEDYHTDTWTWVRDVVEVRRIVQLSK